MALVYEKLSNTVLSAAYTVHRSLGSGLLESVYQKAFEAKVCALIHCLFALSLEKNPEIQLKVFSTDISFLTVLYYHDTGLQLNERCY